MNGSQSEWFQSNLYKVYSFLVTAIKLIWINKGLQNEYVLDKFVSNELISYELNWKIQLQLEICLNKIWK